MANKVVYESRPLLVHLVEEEQKRNAALIARYKGILDDLPKGKAYVRKLGRKGKSERAYVYVSRRVPGRKHPESKYIGPLHSERANKLYQQIEDRNKLEAQLFSLKIEKRMIEKALREYRRSR